MAGIRLQASTSTPISTGTTKRTILQIAAPTHQRLKVTEWGITFEGVSNTATPIEVECERQTTTPAGSDAATVERLDVDGAETIQSSAAQLFDGTTQPTADGVVGTPVFVHPQGGYHYQARHGNEIIVPGGKMLGISVTADAAVNCHAFFVFEE